LDWVIYVVALPGEKAAKAVPTASGKQVQPAGIDLRVALVEKLLDEGSIGRSGKVIPKGEIIEPVNGWWMLKPGGYRIRFDDVVEVPEDAVGLCFPRSSLLRMGVTLHCAVWDPGYKGRGQALMVVHNPHGIKLEVRSRVAQIVFIRLEEAPGTLYRGAYYGEGLSDKGNQL